MFFPALRVGILLGVRRIQRSSLWITFFVIFIMTLTFLNLVVVSGILVGLIEGSAQGNREFYTGDVIITTLPTESIIENSFTITSTLENLPAVESYSARSTEGVSIEANYRERRRQDELADVVGTNMIGIDPEKEDATVSLGDFVAEGEYLNPDDDGYILLGANLLERYLADFGNTDFVGISEIYPGSKVRVTVGERSKEFIVKGIIDSKVGELALRAYVLDRDFRALTGRTGKELNEITVIAKEGVQASELKRQIVDSGLTEHAVAETWEEAQGQFLLDIKDTFNLLGTVIGSIGLVVASITIFIIIFINAITRRKFIGILKGIGITAAAIEISYVLQSLFYALIGSGIGLGLVYSVLVPYFAENPIDFPFSDGILVAPLESTLLRLTILIIMTIIAGFIPAWIIIKKNTLDSILGR